MNGRDGNGKRKPMACDVHTFLRTPFQDGNRMR